ncbi:MAG: entericidin A/B family lipoprotein [Silanimonas sp.]
MTQFRLIAVALLALVALSACNTVAGFGKDVKKVGEVMEREADEAKN